MFSDSTAAARQYVYSIVVAAIPVLLLLGLVTSDQVEVYLQLAAALLGLGTTTVATVKISQQRKAGILP
jgi:hypothetical protein